MIRRVLAAAALAVLAACAAPAPAPPPAELPVTDADRPFLTQVRRNTGIEASDGQLVTLADRACGNLNETRQLTSAVDALRDGVGWTFEDSAYFVGSAIRAYCPELADVAQ